jgi:type IV pilus assembly protein PilA
MHNKKGFTLVEIMIVVVIIGLLAAMAIPAFQKVRGTAQEKAITNNLRQVVSGAQRYMAETGESQVDFAALLADGYFPPMTTVAGEDYTGITIDNSTTEISVTTNTGLEIKFSTM